MQKQHFSGHCTTWSTLIAVYHLYSVMVMMMIFSLIMMKHKFSITTTTLIAVYHLNSVIVMIILISLIILTKNVQMYECEVFEYGETIDCKNKAECLEVQVS